MVNFSFTCKEFVKCLLLLTLSLHICACTNPAGNTIDLTQLVVPIAAEIGIDMEASDLVKYLGHLQG